MNRRLPIAFVVAALTTAGIVASVRHEHHGHANVGEGSGAVVATPPPSPQPVQAPPAPTSVRSSSVAAPDPATAPQRVHRRDVEHLARRFTAAWTTLEHGDNDPAARAELAATITPEFARELAAEHLPTNPDKARLAGVRILTEPGRRDRWMTVLHLIRHQSSLYLQLDIERNDGRLLVRGFSD